MPLKNSIVLRLSNNYRGIAILSLFGLFVLTADLAHAQPGSSLRTVEGSWVRTDEVGTGNGVGVPGAKADLLPEFAALAARPEAPRGRAFTENRAHSTDEAYVVVDHPCEGGVGGGQSYNPDSSAIHVVVGKVEVLIVRERLGPRHIFIDGRSHPDMSRWQSTMRGAEKLRAAPDIGDSIGHYEGDVLVVDTVGLKSGAAPNGGWKSPETHLTERYEVSPDGNHLTIRYAWTDPKIYRTPFTYNHTFERLPPGSVAFEQFCDASDPKEQYSVAPPKQK